MAQPKTEDEFMEWVKGLANEFKPAVGDTDLSRVLRNDNLTKHRDEKIVQAIAGSMCVQQRKAPTWASARSAITKSLDSYCP